LKLLLKSEYDLKFACETNLSSKDDILSPLK
jgi:hypothetical protein